MKNLNIACLDEIEEEVEKELQVLKREHKVNFIRINGYYLLKNIFDY